MELCLCLVACLQPRRRSIYERGRHMGRASSARSNGSSNMAEGRPARLAQVGILLLVAACAGEPGSQTGKKDQHDNSNCPPSSPTPGATGPTGPTGPSGTPTG